MADDFWENVFEAAVEIAVTIAINEAEQALFGGGKTPKSEAGQFAMLQAIPPCTILVGGYARVAGAYALREATGGNYIAVQLLNDGRVDGFLQYYLNDDYVGIDGDGYVTTVNGLGPDDHDGRYIDDRVLIKTRLGVDPETAYSEAIALFPTLWTSAHRGDGTASIMMRCTLPIPKYRAQAFPNGMPSLSAVTRGVFYDWREDSTAGGSGSQRRNDETTWQPSDNPVVNLIHKEWYRWGTDWDRVIAPVLADLTDEADYCDDSVSTVDGTEARYRVAGWHYDDTPKSEQIQRLCECMDAYYTHNGQGHLIVKSGRYVAPTFTLTGAHIEGYEWTRGRADEDAVDRLVVSFTSADNNYNEVNCDDWIITEGGPRSETLSLPWVPSHSQARRLAKRRASRLNPVRYGRVVAGPYGLNGLGERYIRVQNPRRESMEDVVCEVTQAEFDPMTGTVVFDLIEADANIDAWNPATEEGEPVTAEPRPAQLPLTAPEIDDANPFYEDVSEGTAGARIEIEAHGSRSDASWFVRWKVSSGATWTETEDTSAAGVSVTLTTGFVPVNSSIDVQVAYRTGSGVVSDWSDTFVVDTSTDSIAPAAPTSGAANVATPGQATISWHNPASLNFYGARVWRAASGAGFGAASDVSGLRLAASNSSDSYTNTVAAGSYDYFVTAENLAATQSSPLGPIAATVI